MSPAGSDRNPGTKAAPWQTIGKALASLSAGQTALVRGGAYRENLVASRRGTATAPITVKAYPGERPVLRPASGGVPLEIASGAAYLRFQGLVIEGATGSSTTNVYASGSANHIELSDCEIRNSQRQGFFSERTTRAIQILRCYIHDNGGHGPDNLDHNVYVEGRDHVIARNVITGARNGWGIQLYPSSGNVLLSSNTIVGSRHGIVVGGQGSDGTSDALVVNNIIAFNERDGISSYWGDGSSGSCNLVESNLGYRNGSKDFDGSEGGLTFRHNVVANPRFIGGSRGASQFRLRPGSPAQRRALRAYAPLFDFAGRRRADAARPALGAFEADLH